MSQARRTSRGAAVWKSCGSSSRASASKAVDDLLLRTVRTKHEKQRSRSRNKIPKTIRYDLENSLICLCDVWFEEIKPHLVRNNIKLHVHSEGAEANTDADASCGSGDYQKHQLPSSALYCSHIDPGAAPHPPRRRNVNYVGSCSTQPTVLKAPCHKPVAPTLRQRRAPQLSSNWTRHEYAQNHRHNDRRIQRPYTIAVHINSKKQAPQAPTGADRRPPRSQNASVKPAERISSTDEADLCGLFKSTFNKGGAVGLRPEIRSPAKRFKLRFQKNK